MTTPAPTTITGPPEWDIGEWPNMLSLRTFSGQSVFFMVARSGMLIWLSVAAGLYGSRLLLVLAVTALAIDLAHTALAGFIQIRGLVLQRWVKALVQGDLEFHADMPGKDEISMYARVLETLRRSLIWSRQLENEQKKLSDELRKKNETLESTLERLRTSQDQIISQQKLAELGELSAGAAHEIRNPLQFVKNFAESSVGLVEELERLVAERDGLTRADVQAELAELAGELKDNMARITRHGARANRIVTDMLELRREGSQTFSFVDLNHLLVQQTMRAYQAALAHNSGFNLKVEKDLDATVGEVRAIPRDLARVFRNIVTNACHAMTEKGETDARFEPVLRLKTRRSEEDVRVTIRDNGIGMTPEVMAKVFNPFFTTKDTDMGTGLGMSHSHDIIREHGGTIAPESVTGEYTEMKIRIPVADEGSGPVRDLPDPQASRATQVDG